MALRFARRRDELLAIGAALVIAVAAVVGAVYVRGAGWLPPSASTSGAAPAPVVTDSTAPDPGLVDKSVSDNLRGVDRSPSPWCHFGFSLGASAPIVCEDPPSLRMTAGTALFLSVVRAVSPTDGTPVLGDTAWANVYQPLRAATASLSICFDQPQVRAILFDGISGSVDPAWATRIADAGTGAWMAAVRPDGVSPCRLHVGGSR